MQLSWTPTDWNLIKDLLSYSHWHHYIIHNWQRIWQMTNNEWGHGHYYAVVGGHRLKKVGNPCTKAHFQQQLISTVFLTEIGLQWRSFNSLRRSALTASLVFSGKIIISTRIVCKELRPYIDTEVFLFFNLLKHRFLCTFPLNLCYMWVC